MLDFAPANDKYIVLLVDITTERCQSSWNDFYAKIPPTHMDITRRSSYQPTDSLPHIRD